LTQSLAEQQRSRKNRKYHKYEMSATLAQVTTYSQVTMVTFYVPTTTAKDPYLLLLIEIYIQRLKLCYIN
jgi:hypothetical protein